MSDRFPARIDIGGPIPRSIRRQLITVMAAENASLGDYDGPVADEALLNDACQEGNVVSLCDAQASYGNFHDLEAFCVQHKIHFDRHNDAYAEYNAELVFYRGGEQPIGLPSDQNGGIMLYSDQVLEILDDRSLDDPAKLAALRRLVKPPETADLEPIRAI